MAQGIPDPSAAPCAGAHPHTPPAICMLSLRVIKSPMLKLSHYPHRGRGLKLVWHGLFDVRVPVMSVWKLRGDFVATVAVRAAVEITITASRNGIELKKINQVQ